jgi:hypothetical protein
MNCVAAIAAIRAARSLIVTSDRALIGRTRLQDFSDVTLLKERGLLRRPVSPVTTAAIALTTPCVVVLQSMRCFGKTRYSMTPKAVYFVAVTRWIGLRV